MNGIRLTLGISGAAFCLVVSGCIYSVPITSKATRTVDTRLLGKWTSKDGEDKIAVVKLDDSNYIVCTDERDVYRVYHSDLANTAFVSVEDLGSEKPQYAYWVWKLSDDGTLSLRNVNDKIVPDDTKDSESVRRLLKENLQNPALFGEGIQMTKDK